MQDVNEDEIEQLLARMDADLRRTRAGINRSAVKRATSDFFLGRGGDTSLPTPLEVAGYLDGLVALRGDASAYAAFSHLQIGASYIWGARKSAFFAIVLRQRRVGAKAVRKTEWEKAARAIGRLPLPWQGEMVELLERSQNCGLQAHGLVWSASRIKAVAEALSRWSEYCAAAKIDWEPTGARLEAYAAELLASGKVGRNSVADYLERIVAGYHDVVTQTPPAPGAAFVVADWKGTRQAPTTKSARQLVGASAVFDRGLSLMDEARSRSTHGLEAAIAYRDGLLLAVAISVPQRSRALSALEFDRTLCLGSRPMIFIDLDGNALKLRQTKKKRTRKHLTIESPLLWDALHDYRNHFRRLFDDGDALFPNMHAPGQALSETQLSSIAGDLTEEHFGVRVSIHRLRDNVATEAAEELPNGSLVGTALLGHKDPRTTRRYDHSQGHDAMRKVNDLLQARRGPMTKLKVR